tara:strand:+ start:63 stop:344 length:282 start_codon:yes stop_codon:yes gene_type:complete
MGKIDLQKYWTDHTVVTDEMVVELKNELKLEPYEGLMIVYDEKHVMAFNEPIPEGFVAWLIVDRRLPRMDGYFLNDSNICYTTPDGKEGRRRE